MGALTKDDADAMLAELGVPTEPISETVDSATHGGFEAASRFDRAVALWQPPMTSADSALLSDKPELDAKVEDRIRNDAYAQSSVEIHRDSIVGDMFLLNAEPNTEVLGIVDDEWAARFKNEIEAKFNTAAESDRAWFDAEGRMTFTEQVRLVVGTAVARGEVLATAEWKRAISRPFSTAIQIIDPDRLETPSENMADPTVRNGIKKNLYGEPIGYYIRKTHRADAKNQLLRNAFPEYKFVPARKPWGRRQVIHLLEVKRPGQTRGFSTLIAALKEMKITKSFRDVTLQSAVMNASIAATIESELPSDVIAAQMGAGSGTEKVIGKTASEMLKSIAKYSGGAKSLAVGGAKIPHLHPGTKLNTQSFAQPGGIGDGFEASLLRYLAAALGVSYEQLSKDYSETNYSSARAGMLETWKHMSAQKKLFANRFARAVFRLWFEEMVNNEKLETMKEAGVPGIYDDPLFLDAFTTCDFMGAAQGQIDELKETQAAIQRVKNGFSTHEIELARLGKDYRAVYKQLAREKKMQIDLDLDFDEKDNQVNATTGDTREANDGST